MRTTLTRALLSALLVVTAATTASAQTPTPEGTTITNTATAGYTDANGNTYTNVTASAAVTVGFKAAVDLQGMPATATAIAGSTGNLMGLTFKNDGNGRDYFSLTETAVPTGMTITGYTWGGTTYGTVAALNAALAAVPAGSRTAAGGSETVTLIYSVAASGAVAGPLTLTLASGRTGSMTDAGSTGFTFTAAALVDVTALEAPTNRLPGVASPRYTTTFRVRNTGSASGTFAITAGGTQTSGYTVSSPTVTLNAGTQQDITVTFDIAGGALAGSAATVTLTAAGTGTPPATTTDNDVHNITVIRPNVTIAKSVFRADGTTPIGAGTVEPGEVITYVITVTNSGSAPASNVAVTDAIPAALTYVASSVASVSGTWTGLGESGGTVSGTVASLSNAAGSNSASFRFRATVK